jgi:hypothetical protein
MDLQTIVRSIDAGTAQAFAHAARNVIDAMLIEGERVRQAHTPQPCDYNAAALSREAPAGGWISHDELRDTSRRLAEAIAAEKWTDGVVCAIKMLTAMGGA